MAARCLSEDVIQNILFDSGEEDDDSDSDFGGECNSNDEDSSQSESESVSESESPDEEEDEIRPAGRARNRPKVDEWKWSTTAGPNIPTKIAFSGNQGIAAAVQIQIPDDPEVLDMFRALIKPHFWDSVAAETNRYATQFFASPVTKKSSLTNEWFPTTADEMTAYFALCILMAQVKKNSLQSYWSQRSITLTPFFGQIMPYRRFLLLSKFLHFQDNTKLDKDNRLGKLEAVIKYLNEIFQDTYTPGENVGLDESLMKFRGRLCFVQFNPSKRARFGIKFYKLCESASGYCVQFVIYHGKKPEGARDAIPTSQAIVMELMAPYLGIGHTIFLDNWYSSPNLYLSLMENNTNAVGTVNPNRKQMPKILKEAKLNKGETKIAFSHGMSALKWMDKKAVHILSTFHENVQMTETGKISRVTKEPIVKPKSILDYNMSMNAVDRQDQQLASFPIMRRYAKGYKKIFFYIMDMAVYNSYALYKKQTGKKKYLYDNYRLDLAEQLLDTVTLPEYKRRGRPSLTPSPARLQAANWAHFPRHIPPTPKKEQPSRDCVVCKKKKTRSSSRYECEKCLVALHIPECFKVYHSQKKF